MNPKVDFYFDKAGQWQPALEKLRTIILDCGLNEDPKWGCPCYGYDQKNIVLLQVFKEYCAILFFKGALLEDAQQILVQQTENVQAARQIRFTKDSEVDKLVDTIKAYVFEAIKVEKAGLKVALKKSTEFKMAEEFQVELDKMPQLKDAFESLTPGRQRAYLLHFSAPKQSKTREARVENCIPKILDGKGLDD